jgi:hypothetical protein
MGNAGGLEPFTLSEPGRKQDSHAGGREILFPTVRNLLLMKI